MRDDDSKFKFGVSVSLSAHVLVGILIFFDLINFGGFPEEEVIYSVTIEGGKRIGGISQVSTDDKSQMAPPKVAQEAPKEEEKVKPEDAEVSIPEKKKEEPKPTPAPTAPPKKATPKPAATAKPTPKKDTKPQKKESIEDINKQLQSAMQRYLGESTEAGGQGFGAAKLGGSGMGGGVVRPPEFFRYRDLLKQHVTSGWRWFDPNSRLKAMVVFDLSERGEISNISLYQSSGNPEFDNSALRAVAHANPAPPPPANVYEFFKKTRVTFDPQDLGF